MFADLFWCLVIYLLYRFVFELVIPITKTVSKMKSTVSQMQEQQQYNQPQEQSKQAPTKAKPSTTNTNEEYIDFEEVKD